MKFPTSYLKRSGYALTAYVMLAVTLLMGITPGLASAAQLTARSIQMSSSNQGATGTSYLVSFTTATTSNIQGIVVDFCDETPLIGDSTCTKPTGFSVGTPTVTGLTGTNPTTGWTAGQLNTNRTLTLTNGSGGSVNSGVAISFTITTVTNPTTDNKTFYARILTYATSAGATGYTAGTPGTRVDDGGVALATGKVINITARVMESLSFCVYKTTCSDDPSFIIGHGANNILDTTAIDTSDVKFSISTNAQGTTTVRVKGDTLKAGSNDIDAPNSGTAGAFTAGTENFGLRISTAGSISSTAPYNGASGSYGFRTANTTSTYGDTMGTITGPVNNSVTTVTYGATAGNTTAAGIYTAAHQYIATASF